MNQESRTLLAITFLLAALFVAMNRMVDSAPLIDFWLALALLVVGLVFALATRFDLGRGQTHEEVAAEAAAPALGRPRVYEFGPGAPQLASPTAVVVTAVETLPMADDPATSSSADDLDLDDVTVDEPAPPPVNGTEKVDDDDRTPAG